MSNHSIPKLTETELRNGTKAGTHDVTKTLIGYKKIECRCSRFSGSEITAEAIATLQIEPGSTIIRPFIPIKNYFGTTIGISTSVSNKLRTNRALITDITDIKPYFYRNYLLNECECYSIRDHSFKYTVGKIIEPIKALDTNIKKECTSGIHFFNQKKDAQDY